VRAGIQIWNLTIIIEGPDVRGCLSPRERTVTGVKTRTAARTFIVIDGSIGWCRPLRFAAFYRQRTLQVRLVCVWMMMS
jgi:hypothetical protein